jgi:hypothetical protein
MGQRTSGLTRRDAIRAGDAAPGKRGTDRFDRYLQA